MSNARSVRFWNLIAKMYARKPVDDPAAYQRKLEHTRAHLRPDMSVLEFGCGTGTTALWHAPHVARIDAIDYAPRMIEIARAKAADQGAKNVRFEVARIEDWPQPAQPYDAVLGMSILHLLQDHRAVLAHVRRLTAPGGMFFSSTVCVNDMPGLMPSLILPVGSALRLLPHVARLSTEGLLADIAAAGFTVEDHWHAGPDRVLFVTARAV